MSSFFALPSSWSLSYLITGSAIDHLLCYGADHAREACQDLANPLPVRVALRASREWCSRSPGKRSARADYGKKFDMTTFPEGYLCVHPTQSKDSKGWSRACNIWRGGSVPKSPEPYFLTVNPSGALPAKNLCHGVSPSLGEDRQ